MDGTLVDTEQLWWDTVAEVAEGLGYALAEHDQPDVLGRPVEHTAGHLARLGGAPAGPIAAELHRAFAERVRTRVVPRPGALALLGALHDEGVPTALVTASPREVAETVVAALAEAGHGGFTVTVTADDTALTKPSPDPYLAACRALRVPPAACVAVEDTPTGVASAEAAGCQVLAVPSVAPIAPAPGRTVLDSLEQATPDRLRALVATAPLPRFLVPELTTRRARAGRPFTATVAGLLRGAARPVTFAAAEAPDWLTVRADGTLDGTPPPAAAGDTAVATVTAVDPHGATAHLTVRIPVAAADAPPLDRVRVMSWNLWLGGSRVDDHRDKQLKVLLAADADVVGLQETAVHAAPELAEALGWFHHRAGENLAILSRHPITQTLGDPDVGFYGATGARIRLDEHPDGTPHELVLWTAHLNYTPYGPYDACFGGLTEPELADRERESGRVREIGQILAEMAPDLAAADRTPVLLTGDFNAPSHLDWTTAAAGLHGGHGPVDWPVSRACERAGLHDSYRQAHPDPVAAPGTTWSPVHPRHEDGSGRPEPQDRIDFVLHAGARLTVLDSTALATGRIAPWPDVAGNDWPSDHAAVVTTYRFA
ncbi:HAD-IA family hydrolase [Streptomyces bambusae]|uniref:HAD-IA family hydrolase n=2 Tax=Streptomyces bambusae TaxID=1550616 RepID=A0ABS6ZEG3_9ACTN|nr:HAD-IA family hydrolase [Streptomyces bambusae]MBW5486116.1 HAD-IA family hydrolase [Streptomyces bambusae]